MCENNLQTAITSYTYIPTYMCIHDYTDRKLPCHCVSYLLLADAATAV